MFRVKLAAEETYRNATRPLIYSSIEGVMNTFNLNRDILTFFNGEAEASRMIGTTFSSERRTDQDTDVGFEERQYIEMEIEEAEANSELDSSHRRETNMPMWLDPITKASISPLYVTKKVNVTVNRYFPDRVLADKYRTRIQSSLKTPRIGQFSGAVHYPLSHSVVNCMATIYSRLVAAGVIDGAATNPLEWFKSCCTVPYDIISNLIGNNACFVFKRLIDSIKLQFNGIDVPKRARGRYAGQYLVEFQYSFYYAELTEWELRYPIMVYQQMTSENYIPEDKQEYINPYPQSQFFEGLMAQRREQYMTWSAPDVFVFPQQDNWRPQGIRLMDEKLQRLAIMEDVEEQVVLNLFRFNGEETFWADNFKEYLKFYHNKVTTRHKNPLYIALYSDNLRILDEQVSMTEDGDIILHRKPTMSAEHRIVLYFDYDVAKYDRDAIDDLTNCDTETMSRWILGVLFPYLPLPGDPEYVGLTPEGVCPWLDWEHDVIDRIVPGADSGDGDGGSDADKIVIYGGDGMIIAKNERFDPNSHSYQYLMTYDASAYLRRK